MKVRVVLPSDPATRVAVLVDGQDLTDIMPITGIQLLAHTGQRGGNLTLTTFADEVEWESMDSTVEINQLSPIRLDDVDPEDLEGRAVEFLGSLDGGEDTAGKAYLRAMKEILSGD